MKVVGIIPSRLKSTRVPEKALVNICGLPLIEHVYKRVILCKELDDVVVATDSEYILRVVEGFGGKAVLTSKDHMNGTERIAEVAESLDCDIVVNIQGDEALVKPEDIRSSIDDLVEHPDAFCSILKARYRRVDTASDIKLVSDIDGYVLYMSRSQLPNISRAVDSKMYKAYHLVSFYRDSLLSYRGLRRGPLEIAESNEYLRILENGYRIHSKEVSSNAVSLDTYDDLQYIASMMASDNLFLNYGK